MLPTPSLTADGFEGHGALNRKENSFPDHRRWARAGSRFRDPPYWQGGWLADLKQPALPAWYPSPGYGISTVFPFATDPEATGGLVKPVARRHLIIISMPFAECFFFFICSCGEQQQQTDPAVLLLLLLLLQLLPAFMSLPLAWDQALALGLGATNPCPTDVHMEPCSASAFKGSSLEYLLLPPRSAPVAAPGRPTPKPFNAHHRDPLTRRGFETSSPLRQSVAASAPAVEYRENA